MSIEELEQRVTAHEQTIRELLELVNDLCEVVRTFHNIDVRQDQEIVKAIKQHTAKRRGQ